jgi:muramoyltetrapeptide carboxypeptidase
MAPASYVERADIEASAKRIESLGYKVFIHPQTYERDGQSAGTPLQKVLALQGLWQRPDIHAIWAAGGGNRSLQILESINFSALSKNPKLFLGYSDITALLNAIYAHTGIVTYHAPTFKSLAAYNNLESLLGILSSAACTMDLSDARILNEGQAEGHLIGGNLSLFQLLPRTLPGAFWSGGILFLEDCGEELSRIDRMFIHLRRLGVLQDIKGLILGEFTDTKDTGRPFGKDIPEMIEEHMEGLNIPIILDAPFGHGKKLYPLPVGAPAILDTKTKNLSVKP